MSYGEILAIIIAIYVIGIVISIFLSIELEDSNWKFAKTKYIFLYPIIPFILFIDLIKSVNNYLNKNNLKQMNLKILGKAMGFMFLPTLGVLLMLLVGFFDPVEMWTWIKSNSGWAIFIRVCIFIAEIGLTTYLYFYYLDKDIKENAKSIPSSEEEIYYNTDLYAIWADRKDNDYFKFYKIKTENPNILIIERKSKK